MDKEIPKRDLAGKTSQSHGCFVYRAKRIEVAHAGQVFCMCTYSFKRGLDYSET
jgi:hypothetical protein